MGEIGLFEAIFTTRAIRKFKPDPVPADLIRKILEAAIQAPNTMNEQTWRFLVVDAEETRHQIGDLYARAYPMGPTSSSSSQYLASHMADAPVLIIPCETGTPNVPQELRGASSVYPAVQNLLLAARAVGLGGVLTTRHRRVAPELKHLLNIPEDVNILCVVPLGFPAMSHGAKTRLPIEEACYRDSWGLPL
jgi:nitroreductase